MKNPFEKLGNKAKAAILVIGLGAAQAQQPKPVEVDLSNKQIKNTLTAQNASPVPFLGDTRAPAKMYPAGIAEVNTPTSQVKIPDSLVEQSVAGIPKVTETPFVMPDAVPVKVASFQEVANNFSLEPGIVTEVDSKLQENSTIYSSTSSFQIEARQLNDERHAYIFSKIQSLEVKSQSGNAEGTHVFEYLKTNDLLKKCLTLADLNTIKKNGILDELLKKYNVTEIFAFGSAIEELGQITPDGHKSKITVPEIIKINGEATIMNRDMEGYFIDKVFKALPPDNTDSNLTANK